MDLTCFPKVINAKIHGAKQDLNHWPGTGPACATGSRRKVSSRPRAAIRQSGRACPRAARSKHPGSTLATVRRGPRPSRAARAKADELLALHTDDWIRELYKQHKHDPLIKYKDSIKKVVGLDRPEEKGLDI